MEQKKQRMQLASYKEKKARDSLALRLKLQKALEVRLANGDPEIRRCVCGKLFNKTVNSTIPHMIGTERFFCIRCPIAPKTRTRKFFSKSKQEWVTFQSRR